MTSDYSLSVQEQYFNDYEYDLAGMADAQQEVEHLELVQKSMWIRELLQDFKIQSHGNFHGETHFGIETRGLDKVNIESVLGLTDSFKFSEFYGNFFTRLSKEEVVERLAIAAYLALEEIIDTHIPSHNSDNLPFWE